MSISAYNYRDYIRKLVDKERYDLSPLLANADVFRQAVQDLAEPFKDKGVTKVAALDALGFAFGGSVARLLGAGLVLIRKEGKTMWHAETYAFRDYSRTDKMFSVVSDAVQASDNVLIVDDWSETGAQLKATFHLVERLQARVAGAALLHIDEPVRRDPSLAAYTHHHLFDY